MAHPIAECWLNGVAKVRPCKPPPMPCRPGMGAVNMMFAVCGIPDCVGGGEDVYQFYMINKSPPKRFTASSSRIFYELHVCNCNANVMLLVLQSGMCSTAIVTSNQ